MSYKCLYIFLEGDDDEYFFNSILKPRLEDKYNYFHIIQYQQGIKYNNLSLKKNLQNYLKSIRSMDFVDLILFRDFDKHKCITEVKEFIRNLIKPLSIDNDEIMIAVIEIESWYAAGIDNTTIRKLRIKNTSIIKKIRNNEKITKNQFNALIPKKVLRKNFMIDLLDNYDLDLARSRNESLDYFIKKRIQANTTN